MRSTFRKYWGEGANGGFRRALKLWAVRNQRRNYGSVHNFGLLLPWDASVNGAAIFLSDRSVMTSTETTPRGTSRTSIMGITLPFVARAPVFSSTRTGRERIAVVISAISTCSHRTLWPTSIGLFELLA